MQKICHNDKKCQCRWVSDSILQAVWTKTKTTNAFKAFWCLNLQGGYLYNFEACQGKGSKNEYADDFGLSPSVVIGLVKSLPKDNFSVFIDNYFSSVTLWKYLKQENIGCISTVKANISKDCPLPLKSKFKKQPKESYQGYQEQNSNVEMGIWNDNGAVTVGFHCKNIQPLSNTRRWSKEAKYYINVPRPAMTGCSNSSMGGTDHMDQSIASYCPLIRNRKWYWPLFLYSVEVSFYNSWLLYRSPEENC